VAIAYQPKVKSVITESHVTEFVLDIEDVLSGSTLEHRIKQSLERNIKKGKRLPNPHAVIDKMLVSVIEGASE
jgi:hypothetical protein